MRTKGNERTNSFKLRIFKTLCFSNPTPVPTFLNPGFSKRSVFQILSPVPTHPMYLVTLITLQKKTIYVWTTNPHK